jgi:hypothetical protein
MSIWQARRVADEPEIVLVEWRIMQTDTGERHFVGVRRDQGTGRVSSAIAEFDTHTRVGVTRSGRKYVLEGAPGADGNADYVWAAWCYINRVGTYRDVTDEMLFPGSQ